MAKDVLGRLGVFESALCALSYLWAQRQRDPNPETFEQWVTARFGKRLYDAFFRSYTQGVGDPGNRDPLAVGYPADQELLPLESRVDDPRPQA